MRIASCWLIVSLAAVAPLAAQSYHVRTYTEAEGLPSSTVRGMAQGPFGRIWFATRSGVAVYDGSRWERFPHRQGINSADTQRIAVDEQGRVWTAAAHTLAVSSWEDGEWIDLPPVETPPECHTSSIQPLGHPGPSGLMVGTSCGLFEWHGRQWRSIAGPADWNVSRVTALTLHEDTLYVATHAGLGRLSIGDGAFAAVPFELPPGRVLGLALDAASTADRLRLWVVGNGWLGRIDGDRFERIAEFAPSADSYSHSVVSFGHDGVVFGSLTALYRYDPTNGIEELTEANGLIGPGAEGLLIDREGHLWVACSRGVTKLISFRLSNYREEHGLADDDVSAVLERRDGGFVFGHPGGVSLLGPDGFRHLPENAVAPGQARTGRVLEIAQSADDTVWLAGQALGLGRLAHGELSWSFPPGSDLISSVVVDRNDRLWVAAKEAVLVGRADGFVPLPRFGIDRGWSVRRLVEGADGTMYALTSVAGLFAWDGTGWERWHSPEQPERNNLFSLHETLAGDLWIGSAAGLLERHGDDLRAVASPRIERPIYFIVRDAKERYWFGTDNGVFRWDGSRLDHLTVEDGLAGRETNRAAGVVDSRGRVWIGTAHGVSVYRDELDRVPALPPQVEVTGLEVSGEPSDVSRTLKLAAKEDDLLFEFRAISFRDEDRILVRTRLEGHEADWSQPRVAGDRRAMYTNLRPGDYRLHLQAMNPRGAWSEPAHSPWITITAPYYRRPWFWLVVLGCGLLLAFVAQAHLYQRRYSRRLQLEVQQRLAELKRAEEELAKAQKLESLGLLAGGIAHDFNNLLTVVLGNLSLLATEVRGDAAKWVNDADGAIERARGLTNQLLIFSRGDEPARVVSRIGPIARESTEFVLNNTRVEATFDLPDTLDLVEVDPTQMHQVFTNLVRNAAEAMPQGGTISVRGRNLTDPPPPLPPGDHVAVEFSDSGPGVADDHLGQLFDPYFTTKETGSGLGLATAYSMVRHHGGLLTVASPEGGGAVFTVYLPSSSTV